MEGYFVCAIIPCECICDMYADYDNMIYLNNKKVFINALLYYLCREN